MAAKVSLHADVTGLFVFHFRDGFDTQNISLRECIRFHQRFIRKKRFFDIELKYLWIVNVEKWKKLLPISQWLHDLRRKSTLDSECSHIAISLGRHCFKHPVERFQITHYRATIKLFFTSNKNRPLFRILTAFIDYHIKCDSQTKNPYIALNTQQHILICCS